MAQDPKNYRDPKVTEPQQRSTGTSWVWIVAAVIVVLLLLAWIFGWFGTDDEFTTVPADDVGVVEEQSGNTVGTTGTTVEGAADDTGQALEGAAEDTGQALEGAAEETGEALNETGQAIEGAVEDTGDAIGGAAESTEETIDITPEAEAPEAGDDVEVQTVPIQPAD